MSLADFDFHILMTCGSIDMVVIVPAINPSKVIRFTTHFNIHVNIHAPSQMKIRMVNI